MTVGEIFLESLSTGVITEHEVNWLASHQTSFDRPEEAAAIRLGRLICLLYTSPSPRDLSTSRMPSSA